MSLLRLKAMIVKEAKQTLRDPFSFLLGILLPIVLLLICGFGMSTDIRKIKLAIVVPSSSEYTTQLIVRFQSSDYFDVQVVHSTEEGESLVRKHRADACLFFPEEFSRRIHYGDLKILITVNASNPALAYTKESYIQSILLSGLTELTRMGKIPVNAMPNQVNSILQMKPRLWFNDANVSTFTLIPGVVVIIIIVIGAFLTSMVMAREYESGNLESLFVSPVHASEILLAKMVNNFFLGMTGFAIALLMAHFVFHLPIRSSWYVILFGSSVFMLMALCMGLFISSVTKNQFVAVEVAAFVTFLPSFLLSGFLFEIKSMPVVLQWITLFVPARYYVDFLQTAFLVGDVWPNIVKNIGILLIFAVVFMILSIIKNPKRLEG